MTAPETLDRYLVPADRTGPFLVIFGVAGGAESEPNGHGSGHDIVLSAASQVLLSALGANDKSPYAVVEMVSPEGGTVRLPYRTVEEGTPYQTRLMRSGELFVPVEQGGAARFATTLVVIGCDSDPLDERALPIGDEEVLRVQATEELGRRIAAGLIPPGSLDLR